MPMVPLGMVALCCSVHAFFACLSRAICVMLVGWGLELRGRDAPPFGHPRRMPPLTSFASVCLLRQRRLQFYTLLCACVPHA